MTDQITKTVRWQDFEVATSTPKKDLREAVKAAIRANPRAFDMGDFDCGTTACIAGWGARIMGSPFPSSRPDYGMSQAACVAESMGFCTAGLVFPTVFLESAWTKELRELYLTNPVEAACAALDYYAIED